jgi:hypothetical protein
MFVTGIYVNAVKSYDNMLTVRQQQPVHKGQKSNAPTTCREQLDNFALYSYFVWNANMQCWEFLIFLYSAQQFCA